MDNKEIRTLQARRRELSDKLSAFDVTLQSRALTDAETAEQLRLQTAFNAVSRSLTAALQDAEAARLAAPAGKSKNQQLRELLRDVRQGTQSREVVLGTGTDGDVQSSGAVSLTIHDIIPTLNEGLGLPAGAQIVTGVEGNELWPVSVDDAELEEVGETAALTDRDLHFDRITPTPRRVGLSVVVSNTAIDNAAFDLLGFVQQKFSLALSKYVAEKLYSQAAWTGNKGPFSGLTPKGNIALDGTAYKSILRAVADFQDAGYDISRICLVIDAATEADLKATPKADGQGGFVIEGGLLAGYPYVVTHYINTELNAEGTALKATDKKYIGIGLFSYEAIQQHGVVRLTVDATSKAVAAKNVTAVVFNSAFSFTDLSVKTTVNGKKSTTSSAFALYTVGAAE